MNLNHSVIGLIAFFFIAGASATAQATKLYVANNGVDSATCGAKTTPCRSIQQAITNATSGDKIIVGSGRYSPVIVNKTVSVESSDGAEATVIDAEGAAVDAVLIQASGVSLGKKKNGFTLKGAGGFKNGLLVANGLNGVRVAGNMAIANTDKGFFLPGGTGHVLSYNVAIGNNNAGFSLFGSASVVSNNLATANTNDGFQILGSSHRVSSNASISNGYVGVLIQGDHHIFSNNVVTGNSLDGIAIVGGSGQQISGNVVLGNKHFGIYVGPAAPTIYKNNIFGNNIYPSAIGNIVYTNCGFFNNSGNTINIINNFWGTATGPSFNEPADDICTGVFGSNQISTPFATKEFKIKVKISDEFSADVLPIKREINSSPSNPASNLKLYSLTGQLLAVLSEEKPSELASLHLPNGLYLAVRVYVDGRREFVKPIMKR
jgi:hypothetical protein